MDGSTFLAGVGRMQNAEGISTIRPDKKECILTLGNARKSLLHVSCVLDFVAIHFQNNVALLKSRIICRAAWLYLFNHSAMDIVGRLQLLAYFRRQVFNPDSPARLAMSFA